METKQIKVCTCCKQTFEISCFSTNKKARDGLHSWCRSCVNAQRRNNRQKYRPAQKRYEVENTEKIKQREKIYKATDRFKRMKSFWDKQYREKNKKTIASQKRTYYADKQHLRRAEYQRNKQGYIARAYQRLYKIKTLTPKDADKKLIQSFYDQAKEMAKLTGIRHEVDHIIPISKGGLHHQSNLQVLVWTENRKKGAQSIEQKRNLE
jgi:5-methylcytosine-specific restriction endonuclease McrA